MSRKFFKIIEKNRNILKIRLAQFLFFFFIRLFFKTFSIHRKFFKVFRKKLKHLIRPAHFLNIFLGYILKHFRYLESFSRFSETIETSYSSSVISFFLIFLGTSLLLESFVTMKNSPISSLQVQVAASYMTNSGSPRAVVVPLDLPLRFAASPNGSSALKEAGIKITLATSTPTVGLVDLFPGK